MSAFVVSHMHINALLTFADNKRMLNEIGYGVDRNKQFTWTDIGCILLAENERSVLYRYPDCVETDKPGTIGEEAIDYRFKTWQQAFTLQHDKLCVWIIKACDCYDYQACETDDYPQSIAHGIIERIRAKAIRSLLAYDEAPWGIDKDESPQRIRRIV